MRPSLTDIDRLDQAHAYRLQRLGRMLRYHLLKLLEPFDAAVERRPSSDSVWMERAEILYKIRDWGDAQKDYQAALDRSGRLSIALRRATDAWVGVARCQARQGRFRDAAKTLEESPLTTTMRRGLASDPAFAEMLEESDYRRSVFLLRDR